MKRIIRVVCLSCVIAGLGLTAGSLLTDTLRKAGQGLEAGGKLAGRGAKAGGKGIAKGAKKGLHEVARGTAKGASKIEDKTN